MQRIEDSRGATVRLDRWAGLAPGDPVVVNVASALRRQWVFVAYVRNGETGDEWIDVRGGRPGELTRRSFRPELIFPIGARRGARLRGPSLFDAPQLALNAPRRLR